MYKKVFRLQDGSEVELNDAGISDAIQRNIIDLDGGVFFHRELEHIKSRTFDIEYAALKARQCIPVSNEAGDGVDEITYRVFDKVGKAEIMSSDDTNIPRADISGKEVTNKVKGFKTGYGWNIDEIASARKAGRSLDVRRAEAATRAMAERFDDIAWFGMPDVGLSGFLSNTEIPVAAATNQWSNLTGPQMYDDFMFNVDQIYTQTLQIEQPDKVLLPVAQRQLLKRTQFAAGTDTTVFEYILRNSEFINKPEQIVGINELAAANSRGNLTQDRMVTYTMNPEKLELEIPVELQYLPVQQRGFAFEVPARARIAGTIVYKPLSARFTDGI